MPRGLGRGALPFFRGVASLVESLKLGSEALRFSAEQMEQDSAARDKRLRRRAVGPRPTAWAFSARSAWRYSR